MDHLVLIKIGEMGAGIFSGAHYDLSNRDKGFYGVYFNPTLYDRTPPVIDHKSIAVRNRKKIKGLFKDKLSRGREFGDKELTVVFSTSLERGTY